MKQSTIWLLNKSSRLLHVQQQSESDALLFSVDAEVLEAPKGSSKVLSILTIDELTN